MSPVPSTAFFTDQYELTMLDAALRSGVVDRPATFEVFARRLPAGRGFGVFAGLGRLLDALEHFQFGRPELAWLRAQAIVSEDTLAWLAELRFGGNIDAYSEGELYTAGSPVLIVEGTFGEAVLLETVALSILNHDSAVAAAAELIVHAAGGRPVIEMGSRRTDTEAAVAAARATYLAGFASTSNLEAGRRYGLPTAGTSAHAFTLLYPTERDAFAAQVAALGPGTTLLVDTYDTEEGIRAAVEVAGPLLGAVRIDSGNLRQWAWTARRLLDELGATGTRVIVTGDLDDRLIASLASDPVDGYGVGTGVVTGLGAPTAGFVYKMVSVGDRAGREAGQHPVEKHSAGKATVGGRKWAWRVQDAATGVFLPTTAAGDRAGAVWVDVVSTEPGCPAPGARPLQRRVVEHGQAIDRPSLEESRAFHRRSRDEFAEGHSLVLRRTDIAPKSVS